jgi:uncharacterized RDD family membrane protein YckC
LRYGGFFRRLAARLVDGFLTLLAAAASFLLFREILGFSPVHAGPPLSFYPYLFVFYLFYHALLESSSLQASLGKILLGLKVTDPEGQRISFRRALWRAFFYQLHGPFLIGLFLAAFTPRKQALHDYAAATLVVRR